MNNRQALDDFLWRFSGGDLQFIRQSAPKSQRRFRLIGMGYITFIAITFLSFFYAFYNVFLLTQPNAQFSAGGLIGVVLTSAVITFLISNIYRLNILSLEPHTLPYKKGKGSVRTSYILRLSIIALLAFFISKLFELFIFHSLVPESYDLCEYMTCNDVQMTNGEVHYLFDLFYLNSHFPFVWGITLIMIIILLFPVFIKYDLRRNEEYFNLKRVVEKEIVNREYEKFKLTYNTVFSQLDTELEKINFDKVRHIERDFIDPPYNTVKKPSQVYHSQDQFLKLFE